MEEEEARPPALDAAAKEAAEVAAEVAEGECKQGGKGERHDWWNAERVAGGPPWRDGAPVPVEAVDSYPAYPAAGTAYPEFAPAIEKPLVFTEDTAGVEQQYVLAESDPWYAEDLEGKVRFPIEDVPPIVSTKERALLGGRVLKWLCVKGDGKFHPTRDSKVMCEYKMWIAGDEEAGQIFDTNEDAEKLQIVIDPPSDSEYRVKDEHRGLVVALQTMVVNEVCKLRIHSSLAWGPAGHFSFPHVEPNADIICQLKLVAIEGGVRGDEQQARPRQEMLYEERMARADENRLKGNKLYQDGKLKDAVATYEMGLSYVGDDFIMQLHGNFMDEAKGVRHPIHLNIAVCQIKLGDYWEAIKHCGYVLAQDPKNIKALFRRGKARARLGQDDDALKDMKEALRLDPDSKSIASELKRLEYEFRGKRKAQNKMYGGLFGDAPEPAKEAEAGGDGAEGDAQAAEAAEDGGTGVTADEREEEGASKPPEPAGADEDFGDDIRQPHEKPQTLAGKVTEQLGRLAFWRTPAKPSDVQ